MSKFIHHGFAVKIPKIPGAPIFIKVYDSRQEAIMDNILTPENNFEIIRGFDLRQMLYNFVIDGRSILTIKQDTTEEIKKAAKILKKKFFVSLDASTDDKPNAIKIDELRYYIRKNMELFFPPEPEPEPEIEHEIEAEAEPDTTRTYGPDTTTTHNPDTTTTRGDWTTPENPYTDTTTTHGPTWAYNDETRTRTYESDGDTDVVLN